MYEWKAEEMKIMNNQLDTSSWNQDEKIQFIDAYTDGRMSYILSLITKFENEKETLKKDSYGRVKTVSLKAWLKKNDPKRMVDDYYHYGSIGFFPMPHRYYSDLHITEDDALNKALELIDDKLNNVLRLLMNKEENYFRSIDPYEIALAEWKTHEESFGNHILWGRKIVISDDNDNERPLTLEELNLLNDGARKLQEYRQKLSEEINISF